MNARGEGAKPAAMLRSMLGADVIFRRCVIASGEDESVSLREGTGDAAIRRATHAYALGTWDIDDQPGVRVPVGIGVTSVPGHEIFIAARYGERGNKISLMHAVMVGGDDERLIALLILNEIRAAAGLPRLHTGMLAQQLMSARVQYLCVPDLPFEPTPMRGAEFCGTIRALTAQSGGAMLLYANGESAPMPALDNERHYVLPLDEPPDERTYLVKGMLDTMLNKRGIYTFFFGHAADAELERVIRTCYMRGDLLLCNSDKLPSVNMAVTAEQFERLTYKHRAGLYHNASAHESMIYLLLEPGADEHLYLLRSTATMGTVLPIYTGFLS
jgi:hypothetical protein